MAGSNNPKGRNVSLVMLVLFSLAMSSIIVSGAVVLTAPKLSSTGYQSLALVLVYFPDALPTKHPRQIVNFVADNVSDALRNVSYGKTWLTAQSTNWLPIARNLTSYGKDGAQWLIKDAVRAADPVFDFSAFDRLVVVHAGESYQDSGLNSSYPSTSWENVVTPTMDGRTFLDAILISENDSLQGYLHEMGHALGAVDLYDYSELDPKAESPPEYVGPWCLMDNGLQMCLFTELKVGWLTERDVVALGRTSLSMELVGMSESVLGYKGLQVNLNATSYYLVEARTAVGLDQYNKEGILITLVNEAVQPGQGIVRVVHPAGTSLLNASLQPNESVSVGGVFSIYVKDRTEHGFYVIAGHETTTTAREEVLMNPLAGDCFSWGATMSERYGNDLFCALQRSIYYPGYLEYVQVLKSIDYGRTWSALFNTTHLGYNCSDPAIQVLGNVPVLACMAWNSSYSTLAFLQGENGTQVTIGPKLSWGGPGVSMVSDLTEPMLHIAYHNQSLANPVVDYVVFADWNGFNLTPVGTPLAYANSPHVILDRSDNSVYCSYYNTTSRGSGICLFGQGNSLWEWTTWGPYALSGLNTDAVAYKDNITLALTEYCHSGSDQWWETRIVEGNPEAGFREVVLLNHTMNPVLFLVGPESGPDIGLVCYCSNNSEFLLLTPSSMGSIILTRSWWDFILIPDWNPSLYNTTVLGVRMGSGGHLMRFVLYEAPLGPYGRPSPFGTGVCAGIWGLTELAAMLLIVVLGSSLLIELGSRDVFLAEALKDITGSSRRKVKSAVTSLTRAILPTAVGVLLFLLVLCQLPVRCISNETYQLRVGMFTSATIDAVFFALVAFVLFVTAGVLRRIQER